MGAGGLAPVRKKPPNPRNLDAPQGNERDTHAKHDTRCARDTLHPSLERGRTVPMLSMKERTSRHPLTNSKFSEPLTLEHL